MIDNMSMKQTKTYEAPQVQAIFLHMEQNVLMDSQQGTRNAVTVEDADAIDGEW